MTRLVDVVRHIRIFNPDFFKEEIHIIGCGATGSRIAMSLAKLGISGNLITLWDDDVIEEHNIANQIYGIGQIGIPKVDALARLIYGNTKAQVNIRKERVNSELKESLNGVLFVLTGDMKSRTDIFENRAKMKIRVPCMIETRMGAEGGYVYTINPKNTVHCTAYQKTLFKDGEEDEESACGNVLSIGATAELISGFAVWQLMRWFNYTQGNKDAEPPVNELFFSLRPFILCDRSWA